MSYYWFNRHEIMQKAKERHSKEKGCWALFKKQRTNKRKVKGVLQKIVTRRKRQD